jgi:hypothetical protein
MVKTKISGLGPSIHPQDRLALFLVISFHGDFRLSYRDDFMLDGFYPVDFIAQPVPRLSEAPA